MGLGVAGSLGLASLIGQAVNDHLTFASNLWTNHQTQKQNKSRWAQEIELANTAHQREVQDLRAAGLNPILSTGTAGAAVPQQAAAEYQSPMSGVSGISDALHTAASLAVADKQADNIGYDAALKKIEVDAYHNASAREKAQIQQGIRDSMMMRGAPKNVIESGYLGMRKEDAQANTANSVPRLTIEEARKQSTWENLKQVKEEEEARQVNKSYEALPLVVPKNLMQEYKKEHNGHTPTAKEFELWRRRRNAKQYKK